MSDSNMDNASSTITTAAMASTLLCTNIPYTKIDATVAPTTTSFITSPLTPVPEQIQQQHHFSSTFITTNMTHSPLSIDQQTVLAWLQKELAVYIEVQLLTLQDLLCSVTSFHIGKSTNEQHSKIAATLPPTNTTENTSTSLILYLLAHHYFPDYISLFSPSPMAYDRMINVDQKVLDQVISLFQDQFQITIAISDFHGHHLTFISYILSIKKSVEQQLLSHNTESPSLSGDLLDQIRNQEANLKKLWATCQQPEEDGIDTKVLFEVFQKEKETYHAILQQAMYDRITFATHIATIDTYFHILSQEKCRSQNRSQKNVETDQYLVEDPTLIGDADIAYLLNELEFIKTKMVKGTVTTKESIEELKQNSNRINQTMEQLKKDYADYSSHNTQQENRQQYALLVQKHQLVNGWVEEVLVWFVEAERISHWIEERIQSVEARMKEQNSIHLIHHGALENVDFNHTETQIQAWNEQHYQLAAEVERFDKEDMTRLRAHVKQLTHIEQQQSQNQKDLSPADTTTIEITLTTLTTLDRLMYLLRRQEYELQLFTLRQAWEQIYPASMEWVQQTLAVVLEFIRTDVVFKVEKVNDAKYSSRKELAIQTLIKLEQDTSTFDTTIFSTVVEKYQALDDACPIELPSHLEKRQVELEEAFERVLMLIGFARQLVEQHLAVADFLNRVFHLKNEGAVLQNEIRTYTEVAGSDMKESQYNMLLNKNKDVLDHFIMQVNFYQEQVIRIITSGTSCITFPEAAVALDPPFTSEEQKNANEAIRNIVDKEKSSLLEMSNSLQNHLSELKIQQLQLQKKVQKWHTEVTRLCKWGEERLKLLDKFDKDIMTKTIDSQSDLKGVLDEEDLIHYKKEIEEQLTKLTQIRQNDYTRLKEQMGALAIHSDELVPLDELLKMVEQSLQSLEQKLDLLNCWMQWETRYTDVNKWLSSITLEIWQFTIQEAQWQPNSTGDIQAIQHELEQFETKVNSFHNKEYQDFHERFTVLEQMFVTKKQTAYTHIQNRQSIVDQNLRNLHGLILYTQQVIDQHKGLSVFMKNVNELDKAGYQLNNEMLQFCQNAMAEDSKLLPRFKSKIAQFSNNVTQLWSEQQENCHPSYIVYPICPKDTWETRPSTAVDNMSADVRTATRSSYEKLQLLLKRLNATLQQLTLSIQYRVGLMKCITEAERIVFVFQQWSTEINTYKFDVEEQSITYLPTEHNGSGELVSLEVDECSIIMDTVWNQQYLKEGLVMLDHKKEALQVVEVLHHPILKFEENNIDQTLQERFETAWRNAHQAYNELEICIGQKTKDFQHYCHQKRYKQQRDLLINLLGQAEEQRPAIPDTMLLIQPKQLGKEQEEFDKFYRQLTEIDVLLNRNTFDAFTEAYQQLFSHLNGKEVHNTDNSKRIHDTAEKSEVEYRRLKSRWEYITDALTSDIQFIISFKQWFELYDGLYNLERNVGEFIQRYSTENNSRDDDTDSALLTDFRRRITVISASLEQVIADDTLKEKNAIESNKSNFDKEYTKVQLLIGQADNLLKEKREQIKLENDRLACQTVVKGILNQMEAAISNVKNSQQQHYNVLNNSFIANNELEDQNVLITSLDQAYRHAVKEHKEHTILQQELHAQSAPSLVFKRIENAPSQATALAEMQKQLEDGLQNLDRTMSNNAAFNQWLRQVISHEKSVKDISTWTENCRNVLDTIGTGEQQDEDSYKLDTVACKMDKFMPVIQSLEELAESISSLTPIAGNDCQQNIQKKITKYMVRAKTDQIIKQWQLIQHDFDNLKKKVLFSKKMALLQQLYNEANTFIVNIPLPTLQETLNMLQQKEQVHDDEKFIQKANKNILVMANMPRQPEVEDIKRQLKIVGTKLSSEAEQLSKQLDKLTTTASQKKLIGYHSLTQEIRCLNDAIQTNDILIDNYLIICPFLTLADELVLLLTALEEVIDQADTTPTGNRAELQAKLIELDARYKYYERKILQQFNHTRRQYRTSSSNTVNHNANDLTHQLIEVFLNELEQKWTHLKKQYKKKKIELGRIIDLTTSTMSNVTAARTRKTSMPTTRMHHITSPTLSTSSSSSSLHTTATNSSTHRRNLLKPPQTSFSKSISGSLSNSQHHHNTSKSATHTRKRITSATSLSPPTAAATSISAASLNTRQRKKSFTPPLPSPAPKRINSYIADPDNDLDMEIGRIINDTPYRVNVKMVPGEVGRYWFGNENPKLCYCRVLKSKMVMVRVGGGWTELSQFLRDHAYLEGDFQPIQYNNPNRKQQYQLHPHPSSSTSSSYGESQVKHHQHDIYNHQHENNNNSYYEQVFQEGFIETTRRQHRNSLSQQSQQSDDPTDSISRFLNENTNKRMQLTAKRSFYNNKTLQQGYKEGDKFITMDSFGNQHEVQMRRALSPNQHFMKKSYSSTTTNTTAAPASSNYINGSDWLDNNFLSVQPLA
ncbi:hypothetical protein BDF20DRAFT_894638 [Mycotypha africana]|uniref:uncharacterized protein n=1 Tax=Mycotypha africana TaxID=64632 RepID=UPI002301C706|nr:uncharacterized protein BDF20DRAFT_894638 [Mycotypha africana]KAI8969351.1 hypothetical protein BDF20DRAFT_894638 [Mycotypha africana]